MEQNQALEIVKQQLTKQRYEHTVGVMETAIKLAKRYGGNEKKAELAAIFHDYAKFRPKHEMEEIIKKEGFDPDLLLFNSELWHAPVGAYLVEKEVGITDFEILQAIRFHTSGRPGMTLLEKIIYLADYIEPGRNFPGVAEVRELAFNNFNQALIQSVHNTIHFLMRKKQPVFPLTFHTFNDLIQQKET